MSEIDKQIAAAKAQYLAKTDYRSLHHRTDSLLARISNPSFLDRITGGVARYRAELSHVSIHIETIERNLEAHIRPLQDLKKQYEKREKQAHLERIRIKKLDRGTDDFKPKRPSPPSRPSNAMREAAEKTKESGEDPQAVLIRLREENLRRRREERRDRSRSSHDRDDSGLER